MSVRSVEEPYSDPGCATYRQELAVLYLPCDGHNNVPRLLCLGHFFAIQSDGALKKYLNFFFKYLYLLANNPIFPQIKLKQLVCYKHIILSA